MYLSLLAGYDEKEKVDEETPPEQNEGPSSPDTDLEDFLDEEEEKKMAQETSLSLMREASSNIDISDISRYKGSLPIPLLPSFPVNGGEYVLLSEIQRSLHLREDEALAILSQRWNLNVGTKENLVKYTEYVLPDPVLDDLNVCFDQSKAMQICFEEAAKYEEPTEEEFKEAEQRLQLLPTPAMKTTIEEGGPIIEEPEEGAPIIEEPVEGGPIIEEPQSSRIALGSIDLWDERTLTRDENASVSKAFVANPIL